MYGSYMTSTTTTTPTVRCVYCEGGTVWGGSAYAPRRRCLVCKGTGRIAPALCGECGDPILDEHEKRWVGNAMFHRDC